MNHLLPPPIHPFPARMAPEIAIEFCRALPQEALVLDPMVGSGTTIRAAIDSGHQAIGIDMDPLAVLISKAWTTPVDSCLFRRRYEEVARNAQVLVNQDLQLPWIDDDIETGEFTERWFGKPQRLALRALAHVLHGRRGPSWDLCRVAFSRIIITKDKGASLARDVSHSRPHISYQSSNFDVISGFERAAETIARRLESEPPRRRATVRLGDARKPKVAAGTVDAVITSPPYLNAIDYLRGHRMSLVWFGYTMKQLREIRGAEVGAERSLRACDQFLADTMHEMGQIDDLPPRLLGMVRRYVRDTRDLGAAIARTLKPGGQALFVVGNSSLKGVFLRNDKAVELAASAAGLTLASRMERELPPNRRYLPPPTGGDGDLNQRMRSEVVMTFKRP
ncbi:DNA methyltransferase [Micromonospora sp. NPDC049580]|uniref:DNA methyltransferase n=1 Tax=Micromonospora sp. NPDC049580 TaxID=3154832 RepID=UPI00344A54D9